MSHRRRIGRTLAGVSLLAAGMAPFATRPVRAQQPPSDARLATLLSSAANRRWYVRLTMTGDSVFTGSLTSARRGRVRVGDHEFGADAIRTLERRVVEGSGARAGALAGGLVFGLAGIGLVSIACGISENSSCGGLDLALGAATGAAFGGTLGGILGGLARPGEYKWVREWPAAPPPRDPFRH